MNGFGTPGLACSPARPGSQAGARSPALTPASWITLGRFLLAALVLSRLLSERPGAPTLLLFLLAALSDTLDGWVARRYDQVSALGKFLDPLADKCLVLSVLVVLGIRGEVPWLPVAVIAVREVGVAALRLTALGRDASFSASIPAKLKTDCQLLAGGLYLLDRLVPGLVLVRGAAAAALYAAMGLALYSAWGYRKAGSRIRERIRSGSAPRPRRSHRAAWPCP